MIHKPLTIRLMSPKPTIHFLQALDAHLEGQKSVAFELGSSLKMWFDECKSVVAAKSLGIPQGLAGSQFD